MTKYMVVLLLPLGVIALVAASLYAVSRLLLPITDLLAQTRDSLHGITAETRPPLSATHSPI